MSCTSSEPSATLFERGMWIGINLQDILYGIELVLYFRTMRIFIARRAQPHKSDMFYAIFSTVMLILITIWITSPISFGQKMWLLDRSYPGGPMAYHNAYSSSVYMSFARFSVAIQQQMADGLMVYRCRVVWGSHRAIVLPSILWLANIGLGLVLDSITSMPGTTFFSGPSAKIGLAYFSSSAFLNVILSFMICYRLLSHARTVKQYLGDKHASPYIIIVSLVVESVLPFTLSGIAFVVSYGMGSPTVGAFSYIHPLVTCVSPQLLILRAASADAWHKDDTMPPESVIRTAFGRANMSDLGYLDRSGIIAHSLETLPNVHEQPGHKDDQV
ncbi:hypothetical protein V8E55_001428 [Tylopilus felleus]